MYDFAPAEGASVEELYDELLAAADALTAGEPDGVANMANVAALLGAFLPDCNWVGFYRLIRGELVLGPFQGRPACIRIPLGQGVCGTAAQEARSMRIEDVHAFPGHIACDARSQSELVVPIMRENKVLAVIDLDSPAQARFGEADQAGMERLARLLADRI